MKRENEDIEILSFDDFEDEFMLNDGIPTPEAKTDPILTSDDVLDTKEEKDIIDEVELDELIKEVAKEEPISKKKKFKIIKKAKKDKKVKKQQDLDEADDSTETRTGKRKKEKKPVNKKVFWIQTVFCTLSVIFILGCCVYYGSRMIKFYKIYNPKTENGEEVKLLGSSITSDAALATEGDGLYRVSGSYIYKGTEVDNYIEFGNTLWRIIKINSDGSIEMATDSYINALDWNTTITDYANSDIRAYLNDVYLNTLNKDMLTNVTYCTDLVTDLSNVTCNSSNSNDYVRLIGITEFLNSEVNSSSFLADSNNYIWLYNSNEKSVWHTNGNSLGASDADSGYLVKAVVHVKNSTQLLSGKGTKDDPYVIEKESNKVEVGNYIKLGEDNWIVYEVNKDNIKLALSGVLSTTYRYSTSDNTFNVESSNSLAEYLNTTYLDSLSYKDLLLDTKWDNGSYTSYKDVTKSTVTSKVGLLNVSDVKTNNIDTTDNYFVITPGDTYYEYMVGSTLRQSKITISRSIKPTISISLTNIKSGKGTAADPYVLEG
jgi:hypothetical protein